MSIKTIRAFWDEPILKIPTFEIISEEDNIRELDISIKSILNKYQRYYIVVKVPIKRTSIYSYLMENKFCFIETQFSINIRLSEYQQNKSRLIPVFSQIELYKVQDECMLNYIVQEVKKGIFQTDRIALESNFGIEISNKRYANWIYESFHDSHCDLLIAQNSSQPVGFSLLKRKDSVIYGLLGGVFNSYEREGYFPEILHNILVHYSNNGFKKLKTDISSNNPEIFRIYQEYGCKISSVRYVFTKLVL